MRVTGRRDGDAGREVEVLDTVGGGDPASTPRRHLQVGHLEPHVRQMRHGRDATTVPAMDALATDLPFTLDEANAAVAESYPGNPNTCVEIGPGYAVVEYVVAAENIRPGGFVSG